MESKKSIAIIGAGIAGLEAATQLINAGYSVTLIEKKPRTGGHINDWYCLFPDFRPSSEIKNNYRDIEKKGVHLLLETKVEKINTNPKGFTLALSNGSYLSAHAILCATGFNVFDARKKEEYGYGIYDNVITAKDFEKEFFGKDTFTIANGKLPKRIGWVHCVGSRDEKAGNIYCSKVCCITGVKQAIEIRRKLPQTEVFCFYMDLRMFGRHYEELYKEAQEKWGVNFIRGRLSEACENPDGSLLLKMEDTLAGKPLKMSVDLLVLLAGFVPPDNIGKMKDLLGIALGNDGFILPVDEHLSPNVTQVKGVFVAGTCTGAKTIPETLADARSAALKIMEYLKK
ncbi:MAG: FAD-dependent oxidoreductase [Lentimicrobiaceae bacterium]|nr:FAD-dependent oxidoreductase [Lentimicrobiaceae bacterium]